MKYILILLASLLTNAAYAAECPQHPFESESATSSTITHETHSILSISSGCKIVAFDAIPEVQRKEWEKELEEKFVNLYQYELSVTNDRDKDIDFLFADHEIQTSSVSEIAQAFVYHIPACSRLQMVYISPWPPKYVSASTVVGGLSESHPGWHWLEGSGTTVLIPDWYQYLKVLYKMSPISGARSTGCLHK